MPRYDYQCKVCGTIHEEIHGFHESKEDCFCPSCREYQKHKRLLGKTSFRLSWQPTPRPGYRTRVKNIGGQVYDEDSWKAKQERKPVDQKEAQEKAHDKKYVTG